MPAKTRDTFLLALEETIRPLADPQAITAACARLLGEHLGVDRCAYADVEADEDTMNVTGDFNRAVSSIVGRYRFADFGDEVLRLMRADKPFVVEDIDVHRPPVGDLAYYRQTMIRSVICVPLHKAGRFVAAMAVHQTTPRSWAPDEVDLVRCVAARCWESIERARVERTLRESDERARLLVEAARQLGSSLDPEAIYERLRETVRTAMPLGGLVVSSYDAADGMIRCAHAWLSGKALDPASLPPVRFSPEGGGMQSQVIRTGHPLMFNDVAERVRDPRGTYYEINPDGTRRNLGQNAPPANVRSAIMVPLLSEGAVVGVVQVMSNTESAYTNRHLALLEGIALQLGLALENARLYRRAHEELEERRRVEVRLREAKEAAEAASRAKGEFLATLSHELRTPLTPVLLTVSLIESHPGLPADLREDVATIRRNVELESRLISDLLDLTRIERGKLQLDEQDVDLHLIIRSAVDICQRETVANLVVDLQALRHTLRGDSTRLQQVFWNLISNAIKFTPPEGTITIRSSNVPGDRVRVEVADTGAGIDPLVLPKLFTAFEQGGVRAARQQAGLGLGLAISKRLTEAHGGTINATSEGRGRGSTFSVELPAVGQFCREAAVLERPTPVVATSTPLNVLLIEDHEPTLRVLERLLRQIGHRVTGVTSVASATAAAGQNGFDLIISDLGLPDGSGLDVMRQLRDRYAGRAIALTGYGMESDVAASRAAGFAEHLTKPVDLKALQASISRLQNVIDSD